MKKEASSQEVVRLQSVETTKLFDMFNYKFDYENEDNVSIVIAPNGCGKTTIFKLIDFIFCPTKEFLQTVLSVPFESFFCTLSNGNVVGLKKAVKTQRITSGDFDNMIDSEMKYYEIEYIEKKASGESRILKFSEYIQEYIQIEEDGEDAFLYTQSKKKSRGIPEPYIHAVSQASDQTWSSSFERNSGFGGYRIGWLQLLRNLRPWRELKYPQVRFISTNRCDKIVGASSYLYLRSSRPFGGLASSTEKRDANKEQNSLEIIQDALRDEISEAVYGFQKKLLETNTALPKDYLQQSNVHHYTKEEFLVKWKEYCDDLDRFADIGMLPSGKMELKIEKLEEIYDSKADFLQIYLYEYQRALEPLRGTYKKLKLLADILNKRNEVTRKVIKFNEYEGAFFECNGKKIPLNALSSGEINDLIMFYRLIFETKEGSLILVDEPETSLHIEWQEEYIDRLLEICELNNCQAIVATHSPFIINGHFDLYPKKKITYED